MQEPSLSHSRLRLGCFDGTVVEIDVHEVYQEVRTIEVNDKPAVSRIDSIDLLIILGIDANDRVY
jgi:hypothetical protein